VHRQDDRVVQAARALQRAAADNTALLEERADLAWPPTTMNYPAEIKRWRDFAECADQPPWRNLTATASGILLFPPEETLG
jgi:hypothetical protein